MTFLIFQEKAPWYFCASMEPEKTFHYSSPDKIAPRFAADAIRLAHMPAGRLMVYALLGGVFTGLGAMFSLLAAGGVPGLEAQYPGVVRLLAGLAFPAGLWLLLGAGAGLFTNDAAALAFARFRGEISGWQVLRVSLWACAANIAGALLAAWLFAYQTGTFSMGPWKDYAIGLAVLKTEAPFGVVLLKGMGANFLVCAGFWMASGTARIGAKAMLLWLPVAAFVALGWEHAIANMFFVPLGIMLGAPVSITSCIWKNLLPAVLGNLAGGILLMALPYYVLWGKKARVQPAPKIPQATAPHEPPAGYISNRQAIEQDLFKILN